MFRKSGNRFSEQNMRKIEKSRAHHDSTQSGCALRPLIGPAPGPDLRIAFGKVRERNLYRQRASHAGRPRRRSRMAASSPVGSNRPLERIPVRWDQSGGKFGLLPPPRAPGLPGSRLILRKSGRPDLRWGRAGEGGSAYGNASASISRPPTPPHHKSGLPDLCTQTRNPGRPGFRGEGSAPSTLHVLHQVERDAL